MRSDKSSIPKNGEHCKRGHEIQSSLLAEDNANKDSLHGYIMTLESLTEAHASICVTS